MSSAIFMMSLSALNISKLNAAELFLCLSALLEGLDCVGEDRMELVPKNPMEDLDELQTEFRFEGRSPPDETCPPTT
jgi:hypothetical protein